MVTLRNSQHGGLDVFSLLEKDWGLTQAAFAPRTFQLPSASARETLSSGVGRPQRGGAEARFYTFVKHCAELLAGQFSLGSLAIPVF